MRNMRVKFYSQPLMNSDILESINRHKQKTEKQKCRFKLNSTDLQTHLNHLTEQANKVRNQFRERTNKEMNKPYNDVKVDESANKPAKKLLYNHL